MKLDELKQQLKPFIKTVTKLRVVLFIALLVIIYVYLIIKAMSLDHAGPSSSALATDVKSQATPAIDQATLNKITQLQDNSVSVQALINEARQNPFQE